MSTNVDTFIPPGYTLVRPISEGAFGQVLEIWEKSTGKSYALKLIPRLTEADQKRAEREVSFLERFRHPRIVGLHESVVRNGYHGIVMDLGKRNLKELMMDYESRNELIPLDVVVLLCIDIAEGLFVMHNHPTHPMCHGDLKPENVLLTEDNRAILCDLGAADASGVNTHSAKELGTFEYNSPERLDDTSQRGTPASDIWSLGVMMHRMVTGWSLFGGKSLQKMMNAISKFEEPQISTPHQPAIPGVLARLLEPNPDNRATSTQLFKGRLLERLLGPETPLSKMRLNHIHSLEQELSAIKEECRALQEAKADNDHIIQSLHIEKVTGLPHLVIYHPKAFQIQDQTFTQIKPEDQLDDENQVEVITLAEPITRGIVSVSVTLHTLTTLELGAPFVISLIIPSGLLVSCDSIGDPMSVDFLSEDGKFLILSPSTEQNYRSEQCHEPLKEGDTVVMEVDMESKPRTVQFFVNGRAGKSYVSGLPQKMGVQIMTEGVGTSFRLNSVTRLTTPTPIAPEMKAIKW
ncbi:putative Carbon catabolite-derepressing protein kinase [Blattamonas nauphoetae]|uniref:non-specific serine/threonine protein kinase n=1 Tax=Blattamonas nauphoetae TaxID=2049346 RepID=A0ABQ9XIE3_9EUKA|nr:putative Carbon catabolite-derepressing protein kinase [Blattamonas nauphoetae]